MNDALRADGLTLAVEAEVKDVLIWMLAALLFIRYASQKIIVSICCRLVRVVPYGLALVALFVVNLTARAHFLDSFHSVIGGSWFGIALGSRGL